MDILGLFVDGGLEDGFFVGGIVDGMSIVGVLVVGRGVAMGGLVVGIGGILVGAGVFMVGAGVGGGGRLPDAGQNSCRAGVRFSCENALNEGSNKDSECEIIALQKNQTNHEQAKDTTNNKTYKSSPTNHIPIQDGIILHSTSHSISPHQSITNNLSTCRNTNQH